MRDFEVLLLISINNRIKVEFYQKKKLGTPPSCGVSRLGAQVKWTFLNIVQGPTTRDGRDRKTIVGCVFHDAALNAYRFCPWGLS